MFGYGLGAETAGPPGAHCPSECAQIPGDTECKKDCYCGAVCRISPDSPAIDEACFADCAISHAAPPGATIVQLGQQLTNGQQCVKQNGEIYCLSKHSHLAKEKYTYLAVGVVGGVAVGALLGYMIR